jgi:hypothetical protein
MGIDFDESGKNDEYGADASEPTGEVGDAGKPRQPAAPVSVQSAPALGASVDSLIAAVMGTGTTQAAPQTVAEALEATQDEYMSQVEERLEIATYYRAALSNPMFDSDTRAARIVQHEMNGFIRERLGVLLSIGSAPKKEETFSTEQIAILRELGNLTPTELAGFRMVLARFGVATSTTPVAAPAPKSAPTPASPTPRAAPAPIAARQAPSPAPLPASTQPAAAPTGEQKPRGPGRPPGSKNKPKGDDEPEYIQAIRRHPNGDEEPLFNKDGTPRMVKVVKKPSQRPVGPGALPMPDPSQMAQITAIQATQRAQALESNPNVQKAFAGLKNPI